MFGKIKYIGESIAHVENLGGETASTDLMNVNVIFEAPDQRILGEVTEFNKEEMKIRFLGEYINDRYVNGVIRKPLLSSVLGKSAIYKEYKVCPSINALLSNHLGIFGNTGSGKSCGVARIVQNLFSNPHMLAYNANIFVFDAYGEYKNAFGSINKINPN